MSAIERSLFERQDGDQTGFWETKVVKWVATPALGTGWPELGASPQAQGDKNQVPSPTGDPVPCHPIGVSGLGAVVP